MTPRVDAVMPSISVRTPRSSEGKRAAEDTPMAVINLPRVSQWGEAARDLKPGRQLPVVLGAAVAGVAIGLGMTLLEGGSPASNVQNETATSGPETTAATTSFELPTELRILELKELQPDGVYEIPFVAAAVPASEAVVAPEADAPVTQPTASQPVVSAPAAAPAAPVQPAAAPVEPAAPAPAAEAPAEPAQASDFYLPSVGAVGGMSGLESQMFNAMNAERAAAGLPAYSYDASLSRLARIRGHQMIDQGYFGHRDPSGYTMYVELLSHFGIGYRYAGENLVSNGYAYDVSAGLAVEGLMSSPTHRANMLDGNFTRVGVGEVTSPSGSHYYTIIFVG